MNTVKTFLHPIKNTVGHLICLIFLLNSLRIFIQNNTILSFYCVHSNIEQIGKSMTISQSESASFNDMSVFKENQVKVPKNHKVDDDKRFPLLGVPNGDQQKYLIRFATNSIC